jgi:ABC-type molybdate transport system substrate-binding protein
MTDTAFGRDAARASADVICFACLFRRPWLRAVATLLCAIALLGPVNARARDLVVYGEPTLEKALKSVGALWQARTGTRVNIFVAPTDLSYAQIDRGARCDVIFALAGAATEEAARTKIIDATTISHALRNRWFSSALSLAAGESPRRVSPTCRG